MTKVKAGKAMIYQEARNAAGSIMRELEGYCVKISIAGGIRREAKKIYEHITFICLPKTVDFSNDLFGKKHHRVEGFINTLARWSNVFGDSSDGQYMRYIHHSGVMVDIYIASEVNWGLVLMMRTGKVAYFKYILNELKSAGFYVKDGFVKKSGGSHVVYTPTEESIYKLIGQEWVLPLTRVG